MHGRTWKRRHCEWTEGELHLLSLQQQPMSRTQDLLLDIKSRLKAMKRRQDSLMNENEALQMRMENAQRELMESRSMATGLVDEMKSLRMAQTIGGKTEETREAKLKINEMVKEIDRCIAMLNK